MFSERFFRPMLMACAVLLASVAVPSAASAQTEQCKEEAVSMSGKARIRGRDAAMKNAVTNWELEVGNKFGNKWKRWTDAQDTTTKCERGKVVGLTVECTVTGRPCSYSARSGDGAGKDDGDEVRRKSDKSDRADRDDNRDQSSKKASSYERRQTHKRSRDRYREAYRYRGSPAYRRAMAHQDYLAVQRSRGLSGAYQRAMAYQSYLARKRDRAEARGWARVNARQEWLEAREWGSRRRHSWYHRARWDD